MHFSVGFVLAALTLSAASSPVESRNGLKIPLTKRNGFPRADGTANIGYLRAHKDRAVSKIQRGLNNYEQNVGSSHPLSKKISQNQKRATGSNKLTDDDGELWQGTISVGTPAVSYTVDYDTGSSDLFLPSSSCNTNCAGHVTYNPSKSSTSKALNKSFSLAYGDGSTVSGKQYSDTVTISGLTATTQTLGSATTYSEGFSKSEFPPDGLLGMAFKSISDYNANPVFQTLVAQSKVTSSVFAFKLSSSGSELYLGGVDSSLYTGDFTWVPVTKEAYWEVALGGVSVAGKSVVSNVDSIIDTGTTLILGTSSDVAKVYQAIPGAKDASSTVGSGYYTVPCNAIPTLSLTFGGKAFTVSPDTFNLGQVSSGSADCVGGLAADDGLGFWIVGDVFLANAYTAFDVGNSRVGFAKLA